MESAGDISAWITPAIIIGLFLWLRADLRALEGRIEKRFDGVDKRFDGVDKRLDGVELRLRAVEVELAEVKGQLSFVRDYILGRNVREPDDAIEPAPGD